MKHSTWKLHDIFVGGFRFNPTSLFSCVRLILGTTNLPALFLSGMQLNRLRSNSDQRQISLCNINAFSVREMMRINGMISQHEFCW